ncbi:MAG TPA: ABA4-like family protein [Chitinophagaceae bacterium]|nr:ABA4-like family protein [Chitinophagaceae bacterium]
MSPDSVFQTCSTIAMVGWLVLLIISPFWSSFDKFLIGIIITLFAIVYLWLIFQIFGPGDFEKFGSLNGVMELFTNKTAVTAGWVHYLAFDLLTGIWIKKNAQKYNIHHLILIPCLLFTFMLGPIGLLLYLLVRLIKTKQYFAANY